MDCFMGCIDFRWGGPFKSSLSNNYNYKRMYIISTCKHFIMEFGRLLYFVSNGVKQGSALSPTLIGNRIDRLYNCLS